MHPARPSFSVSERSLSLLLSWLFRHILGTSAALETNQLSQMGSRKPSLNMHTKVSSKAVCTTYWLFQNTFFEPLGFIVVFLRLSFSVCLDSIHLWVVRGCFRHRGTCWSRDALTKMEYSLFTLSSSHAADLKKQQARDWTLAPVLPSLFSHCTLSPGISRPVIWCLFDFFICFYFFLGGRQGSLRKERGNALFLISPFCVESTCPQW